MKKLIPLLFIFAAALFFVGCDEKDKGHLVRFYLEAPSAGRTGVWSQPMTMPGTGLTYYVKREALITEANITNVQLVRVQSGQLAFLFHLDEQGSRALYRASVADNGRMIILVVNGAPIGARQLDGSISDGRLYTFTDLPEDEMKELYDKLTENAKLVQDLKRQHGY